jgi:hypothetical protein
MAEAQGDEADTEAEAEGQGEEIAAAPADGDIVTGTLAYLARALVAHPDDVRVELADGERGPVYRLHVNPEDMGRVIGRAGRIARALRQVTRAAAAKAGTTAFIEIAE